MQHYKMGRAMRPILRLMLGVPATLATHDMSILSAPSGRHSPHLPTPRLCVLAGEKRPTLRRFVLFVTFCG